MNKAKKLLIFDMDGTLYKFKEGSFRNSGLNKKILENAKLFIQNKLEKNQVEAEQILTEIIEEFGEDISIALEKKYNLDRYEYFNTVWDISAKDFIQQNDKLSIILNKYKDKFIFAILSDAPRIWINNVLAELKVKELFADNIFSGEGDSRKGFNNAFENILATFEIKPKDCLVFGDQEETDIIPAKKLGLKTVLVNQTGQSKEADYNVDSILDIEEILNKEEK